MNPDPVQGCADAARAAPTPPVPEPPLPADHPAIVAGDRAAAPAQRDAALAALPALVGDWIAPVTLPRSRRGRHVFHIDAAGESLTRIVQALAKGKFTPRGRAAFVAWCRAVARRHLLNYRRNERRHHVRREPLHDDRPPDRPARDASPEYAALVRLYDPDAPWPAAALRAIERWPARTRVAVLVHTGLWQKASRRVRARWRRAAKLRGPCPPRTAPPAQQARLLAACLGVSAGALRVLIHRGLALLAALDETGLSAEYLGRRRRA